MPLVVLGSALVGDRVAVLGGDRPGRGEALLVGRAAEEELLGLGGHEMLGADRGQAEAGRHDNRPSRLPAQAPAETQHRSDGGHRPVAGPPRDLLVRAARAGLHRHPDLGQQLAGSDDGLVRAQVELPDRDHPVAVLAADDRGRPRRGEHRGQVLGRVSLAQRPADRSPQPDDRVRDDALGVVEDREKLTRDGRIEQVRVPGQGADAQLAAGQPDEGELGQLVDVDEHFGLGQPQLHHRDDAVAARHDTGVGPAQQRQRMLDAGRPLVFDLRGDLHVLHHSAWVGIAQPQL